MYGIYDIKSGHRLTDDLEIHFLEMPKARPKSVKEMKRLERWLAYFANKLSTEEMEELAMRETAINEALKAESLFMQDEVERWKYEQQEKAMRDKISLLYSAREEGIGIGIKKGCEETNINNAMKMLRKGLDIALISQVTDLPAQRLSQLAKDNGLGSIVSEQGGISDAGNSDK